MSGVRLTKVQEREMAHSFRLAIEAVDRCRELLINADADADDLAEYDAARDGLRFTLEDWLESKAGRLALSNTTKATQP